jgi:hypothetical protein
MTVCNKYEMAIDVLSIESKQLKKFHNRVYLTKFLSEDNFNNGYKPTIIGLNTKCNTL